MKHFPLFCCYMTAVILMAQAPPDTDIYLLSVSQQGDTWTFSSPKNITPRKGYDNQPAFLPDGQGLLYVSAQSSGQTDIYQYSLSNGSSQRLTQTKNRSEYSPIWTPDEKSVCALVVEEDSSQRMWLYPTEGGSGRRLTDKMEQIGYYTWYHKKKVAAFVLGDKFTLQCFHVKKQKSKTIASDIGRAVQKHPLTGAVSFVQKGETPWMIRTWDPKKKKLSDVVQTLEGSEDYCWTPEGYLLMSQGSQLYRYRPGIDQSWQSLGDLGVGEFYRIALSPTGKHLAVVVFQGEKP